MKKFIVILFILFLLVAAVMLDIGDKECKKPKSEFTIDEVLYAADRLKIPFTYFTPYNLKKGMDKELEHGRVDPQTNVTNDDVLITAKIAWAHLKRDCKCY